MRTHDGRNSSTQPSRLRLDPKMQWAVPPPPGIAARILDSTETAGREALMTIRSTECAWPMVCRTGRQMLPLALQV
jgi:hypothetical protein